MKKYNELFNNLKEIENEFDVKTSLKDKNIIYAWYDIESYQGNATVFFKKNGKLFEVQGGHCSCTGLENQWEPEEVTIEALRYRKRAQEQRKEKAWGTWTEEEIESTAYNCLVDIDLDKIKEALCQQ